MGMYSQSALAEAGVNQEEPLLDPLVAQRWLIATGRVNLSELGKLVPHEDVDHLGMAGLLIAVGSEPEYLSDRYNEVKDGKFEVDISVIKGIAVALHAEYSKP